MPTGPVFISHSSRDAALAHDLVAALEAVGVACWISGRDVAPGANYQEAIVAAIRGGRAMVLLLTEAANASDEMKKELSLASAAGVAVYPVRFGGVVPNSALSYELATRQWIEGGDVAALAQRLAAAIGGHASPPPPPIAGKAAPAPLALPDKPSLAVLPFQNMSGDAEQDYFVDGLVEDITSALSRTGWLFVIARNTSFTYKGRAVDIKQVGRDLGVRYVLEGSVRKSANRIRITCQLIEAATGHTIWTDRFDGQLEDIFDLQDRITETVVGALDPTLKRAEIARAIAKPNENLDAYDLYLRALALREARTADSFDVRIALLSQALTISPGFIRAKALLCVTYSARIEMRLEVTGDDEAAATLAREVAASDTSDPDSLGDCAMTLSRAKGDFPAAFAAARRGLHGNPNSFSVLRALAWVHCHSNDPQPAIDYFERALRLSPRDPSVASVRAGLGNALLMLGRTTDALPILEQAAEEAPSWPFTHMCLIRALVSLGRGDDARAAASRLMQIRPDFRIGPPIPFLYTPEYYVARREALRAAGLPEE